MLRVGRPAVIDRELTAAGAAAPVVPVPRVIDRADFATGSAVLLEQMALAQQALLAELAAGEGDKAGARTLAREVRRWATALGLSRLESQAADIDSGQ